MLIMSLSMFVMRLVLCFFGSGGSKRLWVQPAAQELDEISFACSDSIISTMYEMQRNYTGLHKIKRSYISVLFFYL